VAYEDVLLVDDEAAFRRVIARNLRSRGVPVREAGSVAEAIREIEARAPDLLLLDVNLPDRTGWDVLRELRRTGLQVPTIIVSAIRIPTSRLDEFQPLAYLPKPFPLEALLSLVMGRAIESGESGADG
jgi:DNA-binding response OmpR family regulator